MPKDIRGWSVAIGDTVAFAVKPGKLVLGTSIGLTTEQSTYGQAVRELYVRLDGPHGKMLRRANQVVKVGER